MRSFRLLLACLILSAPLFAFAAEHPIETELRRTFPSIPLTSRATFEHDELFVGSVTASGLRAGWGAGLDEALRVLYPATFADPIVIETNTQRVVLRAKGARSGAAVESNGKVIYAGVYESVDAIDVPRPGSGARLLLVRDPRAPTVFEFEIVHTDGVSGVAIEAGALSFLPLPHMATAPGELPGARRGQRERSLRIDAPLVIDARGERHPTAARWRVEGDGLVPDAVTLAIDTSSVAYPFVADGTVRIVGTLGTSRTTHTATLLLDGRVLVAGGTFELDPLASAEIYDPRLGIAVETVGLRFARRNHTATLLPDGRVLIVGGDTDLSQPIGSIELFDPARGTFTVVAHLSYPRRKHTATLLRDGRVLVAGGWEDEDYCLNEAEIFNPANGTLTTVLLRRERGGHTATLLRDGRVLLAGGSADEHGLEPAAEIYDPAANTSVLTGSLTTSREDHSATLLPDGRVLLAGGDDGAFAILDGAELYAPTTGIFTPTDGLAVARAGHTATLLPDATVLVTGGASITTARTDVYYPVTNLFDVGPSLVSTRGGQTATLLPSGRVLVAGGRNAEGLYVLSVEEYDSSVPAVTGAESMMTARRMTTSTPLPNGKVLIAGGYSSVALATAELFDVASGDFAATGNLLHARYLHTATLLRNGKVLFVGGIGAGGSRLATAELYDPTTATVTITGSLATARYAHTATLLGDGRVLIAGGNGEAGVIAALELFDPETGTFTPTGGASDDPMQGHTATLLPDGTVLLCGGTATGDTLLSRARVYRPATGHLELSGFMLQPRTGHSATVLPDGLVLIAAGLNAATTVAQAEYFDPVLSRFLPAPEMSHPRWGHTATLLPDGTVLFAGGFNSSMIASTSTELFSEWFTPGPLLQTARASHVATVLTDGSVLVAGGFNTGVSIASAEIFDSGLGFAASRRPRLESVPASIAIPAPLTLVGSGFRGDGEGSNGSSRSSPADHPVVRLQRLDGEENSVLEPTSMFTDTTWSTQIASLTPGFYRLTMFVNGIPSLQKIVRMTLATPTISSVAPNRGVASGGQQVVLVGTNLTGARVTIGGAIATTIATTASSVTFVTPAHPPEIVDIVVSTPAGASTTAADAYTYVANPPTNVVATASSPTSVSVTWTAAIGATTYEVLRKAAAGSFTPLAAVAGTNFTDLTAVANRAYLYAVRASAPHLSDPSNADLATTMVWTDQPLVVGTTPVRAVHMTQLRTAVGAVRDLAGLTPAAFTDPAIVAGITIVKAIHITQLRTALDQARAALTLAPWTYTRTLTPLVSLVRVSDVNDVRNAVK